MTKTNKVWDLIKSNNSGTELKVKDVASTLGMNVYQVSGCLSILQTNGLIFCHRIYDKISKRMLSIIEVR